jgi:hypothetical protein
VPARREESAELIIENPSVFAIESSIVQAYERLSSRALGFFVVYVGGRCYGRRSPDATMLACSHNEVERRIAQRGSHTASFASEEAGKIADAFRNAFYAEKHQESYFGIPRLAFREMIQSGRIVWAPDGDEAFDDGSYVLQFDLRERVRLIAFKCGQSYVHDAATLTDVWLPADDFYSALQRWHNAFEAEWTSMPKKSDSEASLLTRATMNNLHTTVASVLAARYTANAGRIRELAAPLTNAQFWHKPYPYGNSFGNLVLHLTGNLNYYIGAQIANTGYVRERPREFNDPTAPSEDEALKGFDHAVNMVLKTIRAQSHEDWSADYSGVGSDSKTRLDMVISCAAHMQHHIGQMIYLSYELDRPAAAMSR